MVVESLTPLCDTLSVPRREGEIKYLERLNATYDIHFQAHKFRN